MFLFHVAYLLISAFKRSSHASPEWIPESNSHIGREYDPPSYLQAHITSSLVVVGIAVACTFIACFPWIFRLCKARLHWRRQSRALQAVGRESETSTREGVALPHCRSAIELDGVLNSSIRSQTESNARILSSNSMIPEFQPSAPPLRVESENDPDEQHLISFKMKAEKTSEQCGICLEPYGVVDVTAGQCLHVFHTACLRGWLAREDSQKLCPLCRNSFHCTIEHIEAFVSTQGTLER